MHQYLVVFIRGGGYTHVWANNHKDAKWKAWHKTGLVVLSTEFVA